MLKRGSWHWPGGCALLRGHRPHRNIHRHRHPAQHPRREGLVDYRNWCRISNEYLSINYSIVSLSDVSQLGPLVMIQVAMVFSDIHGLLMCMPTWGRSGYLVINVTDRLWHGNRHPQDDSKCASSAFRHDSDRGQFSLYSHTHTRALLDTSHLPSFALRLYSHSICRLSIG